MEKRLVKALLRKDVYNKVKGVIPRSAFATEHRQLLETIELAHSKYDCDLNIDEVLELHKQTKVVTPTKSKLLDLMASAIEKEEVHSPELIVDLIKGIQRKEKALRVAELAIQIHDTNVGDFNEIIRVATGATTASSGIGRGQRIAPEHTGLDQIVESRRETRKLHFRLPSLEEKVCGFGPGHCIEVFGRPEVGKSSFIVSEVAGWLNTRVPIEDDEDCDGDEKSPVEPQSGSDTVQQASSASSREGAGSSREGSQSLEPSQLLERADGVGPSSTKEEATSQSTPEVRIQVHRRIRGQDEQDRGNSIGSDVPLVLEKGDGQEFPGRAGDPSQAQVLEQDANGGVEGTEGTFEATTSIPDLRSDRKHPRSEAPSVERHERPDHSQSGQGRSLLSEQASSVSTVQGREDARALGRSRTGASSSSASDTIGQNPEKDQGAKRKSGGQEQKATRPCRILCLANEEPSSQIALRIAQSYFSLKEADLRKVARTERESWDAARQNLWLFDASGFNIGDVACLCGAIRPDVVVVDQTDKLALGLVPNIDYNDGNLDPRIQRLVDRTVPAGKSWERLGALYASMREIAKLFSCAVFCVTQASDSATGRSIVTYDMMAESRTSKAAEADLIIGIGTPAIINAMGEDTGVRTLTISKNKISGWKGTFQVEFDHLTATWIG